MTGTNSHTPGPWIPQRADSHFWHVDAPPPSKRGSAVRVATTIRGKADTLLIAAAPDMLSELKLAADRLEMALEELSNVSEWIRPDVPTVKDGVRALLGAAHDHDWVGAARAAIAKAEGGAS